MKKHVIQFLTLCLVTTFTFSFSAGQTIPGIHLGRLEFVRPPERLSNDMRKLKVTMSKTEGITSKFASKVGGVAFVQVAQPTFRVESFSLQCDSDNNSAYTVINGKRYNIPLETWQLMPIVAYANSKYNAAVSLFGQGLYQGYGHSDTIRTVFHNAFIDNLLGLRLLQTDILLTDYLQVEEKGLLPTFDNAVTPILSMSEQLLYNPHITVSSLTALNRIHDIMRSHKQYNSYIFTDFVDSITGDNIKFNVKAGSLLIEGYPYYYFIHKTEQIDTTATLLEFFETIDNNLLKQSYSPYCKEIRKKLKKHDYNNAKSEFINKYNHISDSATAFTIFHKKINDLEKFISDFKNKYPEQYQPLKEQNKLFYDLNERFLKDKDSISNDIVIVPLSTAWRTVINTVDMNLADSLSFPSYDDYLICYFYQNPTHKIIKLTELTNDLREKNELVRNLNPIVYDAAVTTCQWTAFFRYAKENYPQDWDLFVKQVKKLQYDAPKVYTPIKLKKR